MNNRTLIDGLDYAEVIVEQDLSLVRHVGDSWAEQGPRAAAN
jgi:hypothetical protein